jgi:hypothetical protein
LSFGLSGSAHAGETARLTADVSSLDFGQIEPAGAAMVPPARVNILISSDAAFQVAIATAPDALASGKVPPARLSWRIPGDRFRDLTPMVPTPIAFGAPATGSSRIAFDLEPRVGWDTPPGRYVSRLQFFVNGVVAADFVNVTFSVPARVDLVVGTQPFDSPSINPAEPDSYSYLRRSAVITSNVAWKLSAWIEGRPRKSNSARTLSSSEFRIASPPGPPVPLSPGVRAVVARGEPTANGPHSVAVEVWIDVRGSEAAGKYQTRLHFSADPDSADLLK